MPGKVYFTFGRMNPFHSGHKKLIMEAMQRAANDNAKFVAFLSQTYTKKRNPLPPNFKLRVAQEFFKNTPITIFHVPSIGHAIGMLKNAGYDEHILVVGQNRNNNFKGFKKVSIPRPPGNISATKVREAATDAKKTYNNFRTLYPESFNQALLRNIYTSIRNTQAPNTPNKKSKVKKRTTSPKKNAATPQPQSRSRRSKRFKSASG